MSGHVVAAVLAQAGFAVGVRLTRFSLRAVGFRSTVVVLERVPQPFASRPPSEGAEIRWAGAIRGASGRPYGANCLERSVFLWFLMHQRGLDGRVRIGVTFEDDELAAHAWVELDDSVVNDDPAVADRFAVFDEDPTGIVFP